jgi:hypothetical protein
MERMEGKRIEAIEEIDGNGIDRMEEIERKGYKFIGQAWAFIGHAWAWASEGTSLRCLMTHVDSPDMRSPVRCV